MDLLLPDFKDERLRELVACAWVHCDGQSPVAFDKIRMQSRYGSDSGFAWARLLLEPDDDEGHTHLHFNIGREKDYREVRDVQKVDAVELGKQIDRFSGRTANLALMAKYAVDLDDLSGRGLISGLRGISTESCGSQLVLDGASMSIVDNSDGFTRLRWDYSEDKDSGEADLVTVRLSAEIEGLIGPRYLLDAIDLMKMGFECFVLDTGKPRHAESSGPGVQEIATA
jgi:hypothetical protein